jgi:hypothetical protein
LAKAPLGDFFLMDEEIFRDTNLATYISDATQRELLPFQLLPAQTETSVVNLAIATGLLGDALGVDRTAMPRAPATGQSTFTFTFRPPSALPIVWEHRNGQIQIDAIFVGRRDEVETLFIVEAKHGRQSSLAKHKLAYAVLAVVPGVSRHLPIVPVYVRVVRSADDLHFLIAECEMPDPRVGLVAIDMVRPRKVSHRVLPQLGYVS